MKSGWAVSLVRLSIVFSNLVLDYRKIAKANPPGLRIHA